jgi:hypothetical protein
MVGQGALLECLDHPDVTAVLALVRRPTGVTHAKLEEIVHEDFFEYGGLGDRLAGSDTCFFCLGVSSAGMREAEYHRLTYELTLAAAVELARLNPEMTFCYVSGTGTDSSERGRVMWARVKGKTENHLLRLPFKAAYMFRPGYIHPMRGITSRTRLYRIFYAVLRPFYPLMRRFLPGMVTTTVNVGRALIHVVQRGYPTRLLENRDINALAE